MSVEAWTLLIGGLLVLFVIYVIAKIIAGGINLATTKVCQACRTRVPNAATKCKACGSDLSAGLEGLGK